MKKVLPDHSYSIFTPLTRISSPALFIFFLLFPIIFSPFLSNAYTYPKQLLLLLTSFVLCISVAARFILQKRVIIPKEIGIVFFFLFTVLSVISLFIIRSDVFSSLTSSLGTGTILFLTGIGASLFLIRDQDHRQQSIWGIWWGSFLLNICTLYSLLGGRFFWQQETAMLFTPSGSPLSTIFFSCLSCIGVFPFIAEKIKKREQKNLLGLLGMAVIIMAGIVGLLGTAKTTILPFILTPRESLMITQKTIESSPLFGSGLGNYIDSYTLYRSNQTNQGNIWNYRFTIGSNLLFHFFTVLGVLGGVCLLLYIVSITYYLFKGWYGKYNFLIGCSLLYHLLLPPDLLSFSTFVICSIIFLSERKKALISIEKKYLASVFLIGVVLLYSISLIQTGKYLIADWYNEQALFFANQNALSTALQKIDSAIYFAPLSSQYKQTASTIAVTRAISRAQIASLTEEEKQNIIQDMDYAVKESKQVVSLSPNHSISWQQSGFIYQQLILITSDAQKLAIEQYREAKARDPLNPELPFILGKLSESAEQYDKALEYYKESIKLKPDYAPPYLALGILLTKTGDEKNANDAFTIADRLFPQNAPERKELEGYIK